MKIAFATTYDACDVRNWSGTGYHIAKTLGRQNLDLRFIGPLPRPKVLWPFFKSKGFFYNHIPLEAYRLPPGNLSGSDASEIAFFPTTISAKSFSSKTVSEEGYCLPMSQAAAVSPSPHG